jgi:DNA-directed RNA polymerase subunit RPC12/RpoP
MSDSFKFKCPFCEQKLDVQSEAQGQVANCPSCNEEIVPVKSTPKIDSFAQGHTDIQGKKKGTITIIGWLGIGFGAFITILGVITVVGVTKGDGSKGFLVVLFGVVIGIACYLWMRRTPQKPNITLQPELSAKGGNWQIELHKTKNVKGQGVLMGILAGVFGGIGCLMPLGFLICSIGFLILGVPFIFVGLLLPIVLPFIMGSQALQGECPYCKTQVTSYFTSQGITCSACKKRIVIRDKRFIKID